jgi:hypothetical protein
MASSPLVSFGTLRTDQPQGIFGVKGVTEGQETVGPTIENLEVTRGLETKFKKDDCGLISTECRNGIVPDKSTRSEL